ncbi:MAG TPA: hypothetical protein DDW50_12730 [Firmicutes bacterium]|jgi:hypothetical protein|nr:hypothetical protein [Bacillota bacterium]
MPSNRSKHLKPQSLIQFQQYFSTEEVCVKYLYQIRWPNGWVCPKCQSKKGYYIEHRHVYECSECHYQASVTAGAIFHKTRTPLHIWFLAVFFSDYRYTWFFFARIKKDAWRFSEKGLATASKNP